MGFTSGRKPARDLERIGWAHRTKGAKRWHVSITPASLEKVMVWLDTTRAEFSPVYIDLNAIKKGVNFNAKD